MVALGVGEVYLAVSHVHVAADYYWFYSIERFYIFEELLFPFHAVVEARKFALRVRGVYVDKVEVWVLECHHAPLGVVALHSDASGDAQRLVACEYGCSGVSFSLGVVIIGLIAFKIYVELSILKHGADDRCIREFFAYEGVDEGCGYFISTYQGDGNPLPTFAGEPIPVALPTADELWGALNDENKVSLYANVNGEVTLYNKNLGD